MTRVALLYFPAGSSIQLPPTMLQSIIKRRAKRMLLSYVRKLFEPRLPIVMPLSRMPIMHTQNMPIVVSHKKAMMLLATDAESQKGGHKVKIKDSHNN